MSAFADPRESAEILACCAQCGSPLPLLPHWLVRGSPLAAYTLHRWSPHFKSLRGRSLGLWKNLRSRWSSLSTLTWRRRHRRRLSLSAIVGHCKLSTSLGTRRGRFFRCLLRVSSRLVVVAAAPPTIDQDKKSMKRLFYLNDFPFGSQHIFMRTKVCFNLPHLLTHLLSIHLRGHKWPWTILN